MIGEMSVSYTHLDVYKRQESSAFESRGLLGFEGSVRPNPDSREVGFGAVATYQVTSGPRLSFTAWPSFCLQPRYLSVV